MSNNRVVLHHFRVHFYYSSKPIISFAESLLWISRLNLHITSLHWIVSSIIFFFFKIQLYSHIEFQLNLIYLIQLNRIKSNQSDEDGSPGTPIPFTVLSANSTAESVFGSVCGQQLISSSDPLGDNLWGTAMEWMPQFDHLDFLKQMFPDR